MDRMRKNWIPETDASSSSCDDDSRQLIQHPQFHYVRNLSDGNKVKIVVICANGEQTLYTFNVTEDSTLQDLLNEITQLSKVNFSDGAKFFVQRNPAVEFDYIVCTGDESCSKPAEDVVDSDEAETIKFAVRKRPRFRILSSPEEKRDSPRPATEVHKISDVAKKKEKQPLKEERDRPELSNGRKAPKRRSTETQFLPQNGELRSSSIDGDATVVKSAKSAVTNTNYAPSDSFAAKIESEIKQSLETDLVHTNPTSSSSEPFPNYNEVIEGGGVLAAIQNTRRGSIPGPQTSLSCKRIMIGSYSYAPEESIIISRDGIRLRAPLLKDDRITVLLQIKFESIVKMIAYLGELIPVLSFVVRSFVGKEVRDLLGMQDSNGPTFKPESRNPIQNMIIIIPRTISEESATILKFLFPPKTLLAEMSIREASSLLLRSLPKSDKTGVRNFVKSLKIKPRTVDSILAGIKETPYKIPKMVIKAEKTKPRNRKNGMDDKMVFKEPKSLVGQEESNSWADDDQLVFQKLESLVEDEKTESWPYDDQMVFQNSKSLVKKEETNSWTDDDQMECDKFLTDTTPIPMKRRKLDENENDEIVSQLRQNLLSLVATIDESPPTVEDAESIKTEEPVEKDSSPRKRTIQSTSVVDDTKNRKTKPVERNLLKECQISIKRFDRRVEDIKNEKIEMFLQKPIDSFSRNGPTEGESDTDSASQLVVVYPAPPALGGITITVRDMSCLRKGHFLNDIIMDFYLKYLCLEVLSEADRSRTYIFSIHFYKRLTNPKPSSESSRTELSPASRRHSQVKKWTKNVNIFEKDFVVVPINKDAHWFVAIICFPNLVGREKVHQFKNDENGVERSSYRRRRAKEMALKPVPYTEKTEIKKRPCILIFDSLASSESDYTPIMSTLRNYLSCEHKVKLGREKIFSEQTIRGASPTVPQQSNFSDCGIYALQYVESFFSNPIKNYELPIETLQHWFGKETVSRKRKDIIELLRMLRIRQ